ncbi:hypothetical protein ACIA49_23665 [Kribbella sp. NPDC051587]|uniref:hypothetical protein n=1 Tax=Kribbella sp. NPDC051587 TaxID=3364119 RepID=UPI0037AC667C
MKILLRFIGYVGGTAVLAYVAFLVGTAYYDRNMCAGDDTTDCLAALGGFFWSIGAIAVCLIAVVVTEVVLWRRRRRAAESTPS